MTQNIFFPQRRPWLTALKVLGHALVVFFFVMPVLALLAPLPLVHTARTDVHGAYHVHSTRSDGKGTPEQIVAAARRAGLSFVILTDHNIQTLDAPAFREGVLVITAEEVSTPSGHVVALGLPRGLTSEERHEDALGHIQALGGTAVLAHPVQNRWPWTDWSAAPRAAGFELYSGDSIFRHALEHPVSLMLPALGAFLGRPVQGIGALMLPDDAATARMLSLSGARPELVLCGLDAHGYPPYQSMFGTLQLHVPVPGDTLPKDAQLAAAEVLASIRQGNAYCTLEGLAPAPGFRLSGLEPGRRAVKVGQSLHAELPGGLPKAWRWRVTGPAHVASDGVTLVADAPGPVQAELWVKAPGLFLVPVWRPWIIPSPFLVIPKEGGA